MIAIRCHHCGVDAEVERVGVRDVCVRCTTYLHCCRNCTFYAPGLHHDCREPNAEAVADKAAGNFCDYFRAIAPGALRAPASDARRRLDELFKKR